MTFPVLIQQNQILIYSVLFLSVAVVAIIYAGYFLRPTRFRKKERNNNGNYPDLSIIVYAHNDAEYLRELLPDLLKQEYPSDIEIIIVNDGENEEVKDVYNYFSLKNRNLYLTFVPAGAKSVSTRKLAMTLGIKAAHHNHLLFLDADSRIDSDRWAAEMAAPYSEGKEVVLGRTYYDPDNFKKECSIFSRFSYLATISSWINSALSGKPYRGDIHNLGFTKEVFKRNNGFSGYLNLKGGVDDIFISKIAYKENCSAIIEEDAIIKISDGRSLKKEYKNSRLSHSFTSSRLNKTSRILIMTGSIAMWAVFTLSSLILISIPPAVLNLSIAIAAITASWIITSYCLLKFGKWAKVRIAYVFAPFLILYYPFDCIFCHIRSRANRSYEYTWKKKGN